MAADGSVLTAMGTASAASLIAYSRAGSVDTAFGAAGRATLPFGGTAAAMANVVAVLRDASGGFVVVGSHFAPGQGYIDVARLDPTGSADPAFAGGAIVSVPAGGARGAAAASDGTLWVWSDQGALFHLSSKGELDTSVGIGGIAQLNVLGTVLAGALDARGRLVVVGVLSQTANNGWFVRRYWL